MTNKSLLRSSLVNNRWYETMLVGNAAFIPILPSYELIETITVSGTQSSITFNNLGDYSTTYKHLQIRGVARSNRGDDNSNGGIRFNNDSGSNYNYQHIQTLSGSFESATSTNQSSVILGYTIAGSSVEANAVGGFVIDLLDVYNTNKFKTVKSFSSQPYGRNFICFVTGAWFSTAPVTSVTFVDVTGSLITNTRMSIYGIR